MFIISDGLNEREILSLIPEYFDDQMDREKIGLVQIEISDIQNGFPGPDPMIGLQQASILIAEGYKVILVGVREYPELEVWGKLISSPSICFCKEEDIRGKLLDCVKKLVIVQ
ncbi:MAG: hypothetical protein UV40_C0017G0002 [Parcubacteria group bacterium GW2011_GWA1_42_7]|nr:MAG: hypothetical protein UV34_C0003G0001 [Parcubacteria group bacterium GW2011_GWB1_42_6]KKS69658.1 MAG: hypothetical protein UV40_C0017G0002 [Parcubacteria group bacterium GW2011_GWA1_42_7]KKU09441.1 MAG: hypothetical protein UX14_C0047G0002 [Parcubacteria group bacterium GW2011_GWF1_45_5]